MISLCETRLKSRLFFKGLFPYLIPKSSHFFSFDEKKNAGPLPFLDTSQIKFQAFLTSGWPP